MHLKSWCLAAAVVGGVGVFGSGCSTSSTPTVSTVTGEIAQATFPVAVEKLTIVNDLGAVTTAAVDASGAFQLSLPQGRSYRVFLSADGKGMPLVVNSALDRLETVLQVSTGGASVAIGKVRYWGGTKVPLSITIPSSPSTPSTQTCVGGVIQGTTQPCASGSATTVCADEDGDSDHGGCMGMHGGDHGDGDDDGDGAGGSGGAGGSSASTAAPTDASASAPMGIPEKNVASSLGCSGERHHGGDHDGDHDGDHHH